MWSKARVAGRPSRSDDHSPPPSASTFERPRPAVREDAHDAVAVGVARRERGAARRSRTAGSCRRRSRGTSARAAPSAARRAPAVPSSVAPFVASTDAQAEACRRRRRGRGSAPPGTRRTGRRRRSPHAASFSSCQSTNGRPATSSIDLGTVSVRGRIRVASPPARTTACTAPFLEHQADARTRPRPAGTCDASAAAPGH